MKKRLGGVNRLAYLGLLGFLSVPLMLYTKNSKWLSLIGFFGVFGYFKKSAKQN